MAEKYNNIKDKVDKRTKEIAGRYEGKLKRKIEFGVKRLLLGPELRYQLISQAGLKAADKLLDLIDNKKYKPHQVESIFDEMCSILNKTRLESKKWGKIIDTIGKYKPEAIEDAAMSFGVYLFSGSSEEIDKALDFVGSKEVRQKIEEKIAKRAEDNKELRRKRRKKKK